MHHFWFSTSITCCYNSIVCCYCSSACCSCRTLAANAAPPAVATVLPVATLAPPAASLVLPLAMAALPVQNAEHLLLLQHHRLLLMLLLAVQFALRSLHHCTNFNMWVSAVAGSSIVFCYSSFVCCKCRTIAATARSPAANALLLLL